MKVIPGYSSSFVFCRCEKMPCHELEFTNYAEQLHSPPAKHDSVFQELSHEMQAAFEAAFRKVLTSCQ